MSARGARLNTFYDQIIRRTQAHLHTHICRSKYSCCLTFLVEAKVRLGRYTRRHAGGPIESQMHRHQMARAEDRLPIVDVDAARLLSLGVRVQSG